MLTGLALLATLAPAAAQTLVSGDAFGVSAALTGVGSVAPNPAVVLPPAGGSTEAHLLALDAPGILTTGTLTAESTGSVGALAATATSEAAVEQLSILAGLVAADAVVARASCSGNGTTASCTDVGTTILGLVVNGTPLGNITPTPNTVIPIPGIGTLVLNEQVTAGDGVTAASLTVNLIHLILNGTLGTGDVIVSSAHADVAPGAVPCVCAQPGNVVSGESFGSEIDLNSVTVEKNPRALLASQGGSAEAGVASVLVPGVLQSGTESQTTSGSVSATSASVQSSSLVEDLSLLAGVIGADVVHAMCSCTGDGTTASCTPAGTEFLNLVVAGITVSLPVPPNTMLSIPGGTVILNEQISGGDGTTTRSLTVNMIHVTLSGLLNGELIVASAHCDVDFAAGSCRCGAPCPSFPSGSFPFLVRTVGRLGNGAQVTGSIGANDPGGRLQLGKRAFVSDGSTVAGDSVVLGQDASVDDVQANLLRLGKGATVRGDITTPVLPLTNPFCPVPLLTCGGPDVLVSSGNAVVLAPGSYGNVLISNGGTLVLEPGTFRFCSFKAGKHAAVLATGGTQTTIDVVGDFRLANGGFLGPAAAPIPLLNLGGTKLRLGSLGTLQALVSAPSAQFRFGRSGQALGGFCVSTLGSDKQIVLGCPP
jgi:hypothetical protein